MTDLNLPPHRTLPPEVRDRIRGVVDAGMSAGTPAPTRRRAPLAVAAGVAVLALGAVVVAQSVHDDPGDRTGSPPATSPAPAPALSEERMSAVVDRCAAAVPDLAPRDRWRPAMGVSGWGVSVVGAHVDGQPVICQTTATNVTVTDPAVPPDFVGDTRNAVLLTSAEGAVAGLADPAWRAVGVRRDVVVHGMFGPAHTSDGFFVALHPLEWPIAGTRLYEEVDDPAAETPEFRVRTPSPPTVVVDRPGAVADADQAQLDRCLAATPAQDGTNWVPAAGSDWAGNRVVLTRAGDRLAVCRPEEGEPPTFIELPAVAATPRLCLIADLPWTAEAPTSEPMAGLAPQGAAYVQLTFESGLRQRVPVVRNTFLALPSQVNADPLKQVQLIDEDNVASSAPLPGDC